ncbi:MAG: heavy-metal-associated domain-containing protein [Ferrimicrobium sp.]
MAIVDLHSPDISCAHCKSSIEKDLSNELGVRSVVVDVATKHVLIDFDDDKNDTDTLRAKLAEIGYPAS